MVLAMSQQRKLSECEAFVQYPVHRDVTLQISINLKGGGGGGLPYTNDGDTRRNFQKQPLKVTILGVAPANFIP